MVEDTSPLIIRLTGKDLATVTGKVKGLVQNSVKMMHKYPHADFSTHRREGWIRIQGVPSEVMREAVLKAQSSLLPYHRFDFDIVPEETTEQKPSGEPEEEAQKMFVIWMEQAQREWKEQAQGYENEIANCQREVQQLKKDKDNILQLMRQEKESAARLQASYGEVSTLLEKMSAERVQPPFEAGKLWVGDWSAIALRLEREFSKLGLGTRMPEMGDLLAFDLDTLWSSVKKEIGEDVDLQKDVLAIEHLSQANTWEESEKYRLLIREYQRAKTEIDYVQSIREGKSNVPASLVESFVKVVDLENDRRLAFEFEAEEAAFRKRTASSGRVAELLERFRVAEAARTLRGSLQTEKPLPALLLCERAESKWQLRLLVPASEGAFSATLRDCVREAGEVAEVKISQEKRQESIINTFLTMPGSVQSWKDASRRQERYALELAKSFRESSAHKLGLQMNLSKLMEISPE